MYDSYILFFPVSWLTLSESCKNVKSILVAIAATLLIVVLTWSVRQVKSHKMPTTETEATENNEISLGYERVLLHFICYCMRDRGGSAVPNVKSGLFIPHKDRAWDKICSSLLTVPVKLFYNRDVSYNTFPLSGRVGVSERGVSGHSFVS